MVAIERQSSRATHERAGTRAGVFMSRSVRAWIVAMAALIGTLAISGTAAAQTYPNGSVRIIVPVPAGGVTDTMARIVAQRLSEFWGQPVVVDNRPGGNYAIGAQAVARAPADGYTLLVAPDSTLTANPHLMSKLP
jgi:tripartite-type tricarboxylate transporter receptor subunit TctC